VSGATPTARQAGSASEPRRVAGSQSGAWQLSGKGLLLAIVLLLAWGAWFVPPTSLARSRGWDEAMHADLPAARLYVAHSGAVDDLPAGAWFEVLHNCQQYPFVYPLLLSASYANFGQSEEVGRRSGRALMGVGLLALFGLGWVLVRRLELERGRRWPELHTAPWLAALFAGLSPLWLAYSGTFFLEAPSATFWALTLWAFVLRDLPRPVLGSRAVDLLAGTCLALALFTKFNYGLLLGLGLALELLCQGWLAFRGRRLLGFLWSSLWFGLPTALLCAWWFVWPWPAPSSLGAEHLSAALGFLSGNQGEDYRALSHRLWDLATVGAPGPLALVLLLLGALMSVPQALKPGPRMLWLLGLSSAAVVLRHPFHLDRFWLPIAVPWIALSALGWARLLGAFVPASPVTWARLAPLAALLALSLALRLPLADALAGRLGLVASADSAAAAYLHGLHQERLSLAADRLLPTAGLERSAYDAFVTAIAAELGPDERVAFLDINSELSPGALHLGLAASTGNLKRLFHEAALVRRDGQPDMVITFEGADPGWQPEQVREWARRFDLILSTEPSDWRRRKGREFLGRYRAALFEGGEWDYRQIGVVPVARPNQAPTDVQLFAVRASQPR
jgi:hypothetical protein